MNFFLLVSRRRLLHLLPAFFLTGCAGLSSRPATDLPSLMVERLGWMDEVAQVKQAKSLPVTDAKREAELLDAMAREGAKHGLPEQAVRAFFSGQIEAAKHFQRQWLAQHAHEPVSPGQKTPDLATTVRPALDALGKRMLTALVRARAMPERAGLLPEARARLAHAGYSEAVIRAAVSGLQAGLE